MISEPFRLELIGGRFDGYTKPLSLLPEQQRLEIVVEPSELVDGDGCAAPSRAAIYDYQESRWSTNPPTVTFRYAYVGTVNVGLPIRQVRSVQRLKAIVRSVKDLFHRPPMPKVIVPQTVLPAAACPPWPTYRSGSSGFRNESP